MNELISKISNFFKKYGVRSIAMDDIAREFCISKKTLYQYFKNKKDVICKVILFEQENELTELDKLCSLHTNAIDQLLSMSRYIVNKHRKLNPALIYDMNKYYPQILEKSTGQRKEYIRMLIKRNFEMGMQQGIYRENLNIDVIAVLYMLSLKEFEVYKEELNGNFDKIFNTFFVYSMRGIVNDEGLEYLEKQLRTIKKH
jgi:TetR/AcrR family transcriptional regulator, cholesterol catabolism regulator